MRRALAFIVLLLTASWSRADDPIAQTYELAYAFEIRASEDGVPGPVNSNSAAVLLTVDADGTQNLLAIEGTWKRKRKEHYAFDNTAGYRAALEAVLLPNQTLPKAKMKCADVQLWTDALHGQLRRIQKIREGSTVFTQKERGAFAGGPP